MARRLRILYMMTRVGLALVVAAVVLGAAGCGSDCSGPKTLPCPVGANVACVDGAWACVPGDQGVSLPRDLATPPAHD